MATQHLTTPANVTYVYAIGGEAYDVPHEAGDCVPENLPESKLKEWLRAGVIKKEKPKKERKR